MLGDIVGQTGCRAVCLALPSLRRTLNTDLVIVNGENAASGFGLTPAQLGELLGAGVDVVTTGNHIWQSKEIYPYLESDQRLLRPENYPSGTPGHGWCVRPVRGVNVGVLNLEGRKSLSTLRCPFRVARETLGVMQPKPGVVVVDFHAEAPDEKEALGVYLDGDVAAVVGTHTHIQTADERVLPGGTAYITDAGMCGPDGSVLGMKREVSVGRYVTQMPLKMEVEDAPSTLSGVLMRVSPTTGRALSIERVRTSGSVASGSA